MTRLPCLDEPDLSEALRGMTNATGTMSGRIRSAERLLNTPKAGFHAKEFLISIFEDRNQHSDLRLYAIQVLRNYEIGTRPHHLTTEQKAERTEAWRWYEIWDLKRAIVQFTGQMPPFGFASVLLNHDYLPPPGSDWPPVTVQRSWFSVIK
jgi:hypothetical protein